MSPLQRIMIFILALAIIGFLMFFAFSIFIIAIILAPIAYLYNKFRGKPISEMQPEDTKQNNNNSNVIDVDYEVVKDEKDSTK